MPLIDGTLFRKAKHLIARDAQEGDENRFGDRIEPGKKVIVQRDDCEEVDGSLDPYTADPIPQVHGESDYRAYGEWRHQKKRNGGRWIGGTYYEEYYTCPVYIARGSEVLQGTIYSSTDPRAEAIAEAEHEDLNQEEDAEAVM